MHRYARLAASAIERMDDVEQGAHDWLRRVPLARVADALGWTRLLRALFGAYWCLSIFLVATEFRPDLLHPTNFGSDSSNYIASAERLRQHGEVYRIYPGDRPVPLDNPPDWSAPILSPPSVPVALQWATLVPDGWRLHLIWAAGIAGTVAVGFLAAAFAPVLLLALGFHYLPGLAIMAFSGNVNALIAPALAVAYRATRSGSGRAQAAAGLLVGLAVMVKLGPAIVGFWVITQRRPIVTVTMLLTGSLLVFATIAIARVNSLMEYVDIVRHQTSVPTSESIPGMLRAAGVSDSFSSAALLLGLGAACLAIVVFRREPLSFLIAVVAATYATSIVRYDSLALWLAASVAWWGHGLVRGSRISDDGSTPRVPARQRRIWQLAALAGMTVAVGASAVSIREGGAQSSSLGFVNQSDRAVVARIGVVAQPASFGYRIGANEGANAWLAIDGQLPAPVTLWSSDCEFLGAIAVPPTGGVITITADRTFRLSSTDPPPRSTAFASDCAVEFRQRVLQAQSVGSRR